MDDRAIVAALDRLTQGVEGLAGRMDRLEARMDRLETGLAEVRSEVTALAARVDLESEAQGITKTAPGQGRLCYIVWQLPRPLPGATLSSTTPPRTWVKPILQG